MMHGFFWMGGYAAFVWPAYAASAFGIAAAIYLTLRTYFRTKKRLAALEVALR